MNTLATSLRGWPRGTASHHGTPTLFSIRVRQHTKPRFLRAKTEPPEWLHLRARGCPSAGTLKLEGVRNIVKLNEAFCATVLGVQVVVQVALLARMLFQQGVNKRVILCLLHWAKSGVEVDDELAMSSSSLDLWSAVTDLSHGLRMRTLPEHFRHTCHGLGLLHALLLLTHVLWLLASFLQTLREPLLAVLETRTAAREAHIMTVTTPPESEGFLNGHTLWATTVRDERAFLQLPQGTRHWDPLLADLGGTAWTAKPKTIQDIIQLSPRPN